jgi:hypothetical protein
MKTLISLCFVFLFGCAGLLRTPDPVVPYQYGDEAKTCEALQADLEKTLENLSALNKKRKTKIGGNIALAAVGVILFPPLLFAMDFSDVDAIEIKAQRDRHESLARIAVDRGCGFYIEPLEPVKSVTKTAMRDER